MINEIENVWAVEDSLQAAGVFRNGIRDTPAHSDSYMTIVSFTHLEEWIKKQTFPKELLAQCVEYWTTNVNQQPPLKLVGYYLKITKL